MLEPLPKVPIKPSLARRVLKQIEKEPTGFFEAVGIRFGKEVTIGKARTKKAAAKKAEKWITKTLGASAFITKDKKKIKAVETGLLKKEAFRKSKVSEFLIVEKKAKRLRKTTTGKEIQMFRTAKKKGKKSKSLFGL